MSHPRRKSHLRRFWKPAAATGAGGAALAVWLEELLLYAEEVLALIFLPILAGVIYLFNHFIFKSHMPTRNNHHPSNHTGAKR